jgi:hypothetical protein
LLALNDRPTDRPPLCIITFEHAVQQHTIGIEEAPLLHKAFMRFHPYRQFNHRHDGSSIDTFIYMHHD